MYPYTFKPLLKQALWGGSRIIPFKQLQLNQDQVGESWEISGVKGSESIVATGPDEGLSLPKLVEKYGADLVGRANYLRFGNQFPLLIKFIDAEQDLSIQVHPNDELAKKRHDSYGKTEMWYVIDAQKEATLYSGFKEKIDSKEYEQRVADSTLTEVLAKHPIAAGDVFFLPAGRVHSIGAGAFIAEIQQTSDITYRIFDFNRKDKNGKLRELHTDLAKEAIDYTVQDDYRTHYKPLQNEPVELVSCTYFTTTLYDFTDEVLCDYTELDSFVIYMIVGGGAKITSGDGYELDVQAGQTVLIPALTQEVQITPHPDGVKLLEVYI